MAALGPFPQRFHVLNQRDYSSTKELGLISAIAASEAEAADGPVFNGLVPRSLWELWRHPSRGRDPCPSLAADRLVLLNANIR